MLFLTMHGINSDHRAGQRKRAEQSLDRRDFIGLFVAVEMRLRPRAAYRLGVDKAHLAAGNRPIVGHSETMADGLIEPPRTGIRGGATMRQAQ
jgi:hypothetical protein